MDPIVTKERFSIWAQMDAYYNAYLQSGSGGPFFRYHDSVKNDFDPKPFIDKLKMELVVQFFEASRWGEEINPTRNYVYRSVSGSSFGYSIMHETHEGEERVFGDLVFSTGKEEDFKEFEAWVKSVKVYKEENCCYALTVEDSYGLTALTQKKVEFIPENYSEEIVRKRQSILRNIESKEPRGRISILAGPPGTGKTKLIQSLIPDMGKKVRIVYLPTYLVSQIDSPKLLGFLLGQAAYKFVFLVEDCDSLLVPRGMDSVNVLSSFLNLTDGILGNCLDIHFIVSTNAKTTEYDPAITRPGRLTELVDFELLDAAHANQVYRRISKREEDIFKKPASLADVYAKALGTAETPLVQVKPRRSVGFTV